jgi:hypothetical protein
MRVFTALPSSRDSVPHAEAKSPIASIPSETAVVTAVETLNVIPTLHWCICRGRWTVHLAQVLHASSDRCTVQQAVTATCACQFTAAGDATYPAFDSSTVLHRGHVPCSEPHQMRGRCGPRRTTEVLGSSPHLLTAGESCRVRALHHQTTSDTAGADSFSAQAMSAELQEKATAGWRGRCPAEAHRRRAHRHGQEDRKEKASSQFVFR